MAVGQIVEAINKFNKNVKENYDCLVIIRGGGSPEDLAAFNEEILVRSVSSSKIPTVLAIGHEIDVSLAELAADVHASTPSNAAELLVPEKNVMIKNLENSRNILIQEINTILNDYKNQLKDSRDLLKEYLGNTLVEMNRSLVNRKEILLAYNPENVLSRGFAIVSNKNKAVKNSNDLKLGDQIDIRLYKGKILAEVKGK